MDRAFPELGYYTLPGHVSDPNVLVDEVRLGEQMGFGSVWISERLNAKHIGVLSGLAAAHAPTMGIAAALITNLTLRHPLVLAGYGSTMSLLTNNRFAMGIGRGIGPLYDAAGVPKVNFRILEDIITILRSLWRGESVNYSGPLGKMQGLSLGTTLETPPPILMAVMGDKTAYWAGQHCDGVIYNSLWSPRAVENSTRLVRQGATDAGRDPDSVRVWSIGVTACELPEDEMLSFVVRRMSTYLAFPGMFETICAANGWDVQVLDKVRQVIEETKRAGGTGSLGDEAVSREMDDIRRTYELYPRHWIEEGCVVGSVTHCAGRVRERFDAGADGVLLHGSTPKYLESLLKAWPDRRPAQRFAGRLPNPGR